jgi:hypothetical protein
MVTAQPHRTKPKAPSDLQPAGFLVAGIDLQALIDAGGGDSAADQAAAVTLIVLV